MKSAIITLEKRIKELEMLIACGETYRHKKVLIFKKELSELRKELKEHRAALDILMQQPISLADVIESVNAKHEKK